MPKEVGSQSRKRNYIKKKKAVKQSKKKKKKSTLHQGQLIELPNAT